MNIQQIRELDTFVADEPKMKTINVNVYLVYRGNFNDERLVESREFAVSELADQPLVWFDLYLGKKKDNPIRLAFAYLKNTDLYFLEDNGTEIKVVQKTGFSHYYSDDYDEKYIIATQIW